MVPNGWEKKSFKDILKLDRGSSPRPIVSFMTDGDDGVNWIKIGDTKGEAAFINSTKEKITKEGAKKSRKVSKGEIILSNSMSYGKPYILNIDGYIHDGWFVIRNYEQNLDKGYLIQLLGGEIVQRQYRRLAAGGVVTNINSELVYFVKVNLPPLPEQRKIAKILGTWDKAISTTERLINNSKQQKKALMQQLLTGKKRLLDDSGKPFEGAWGEVRLGDLIEEFVNGYAFTASNYKNHGIPIITMGNISLDGNFDERQLKQNFWEDDDALDKYKIKLGDLLIAMTDVTPDKNLIGRMTIVDVDKTFYLNQRVGLLKLSNKIDSIFLKYLSNESSWRKYSIAVSASGVQANMGTKDIKKGVIHLPHLDEQQKIASVLSNADQEIELLEQQLVDLKQEKKALMQQLLTGKRRVKLDDKEVA